MKQRLLFTTVMSMLLTIALLLSTKLPSYAQIVGHQKISETEGNFAGVLEDGDLFGWAPYKIGDLDGDGVVDLAVGTPGDAGKGAVWILILNSDGTVKAHQKINDTVGGFTGELSGSDNFGHSIAPIGDFNGDGVVDIAVGSLFDDDSGPDRGAIWILFLNADGTVKAHQKISDTVGGFEDTLLDNDGFGHGITLLGDFNNDGVVDLAAATGHINYQGKSGYC